MSRSTLITTYNCPKLKQKEMLVSVPRGQATPLTSAYGTAITKAPLMAALAKKTEKKKKKEEREKKNLRTFISRELTRGSTLN